MQPTSPSPEMGGRRAPELSPQENNEALRMPERPVASPEVEARSPSSVVVAPITPLPQLPVLPMPQQSSITRVPTKDPNPVVASDDDVIEKAWVDKAKKIVEQTKADPYLQEKEVSKLQADYLKKRYGKEIKVSGDS